MTKITAVFISFLIYCLLFLLIFYFCNKFEVKNEFVKFGDLNVEIQINEFGEKQSIAKQDFTKVVSKKIQTSKPSNKMMEKSNNIDNLFANLQVSRPKTQKVQEIVEKKENSANNDTFYKNLDIVKDVLNNTTIKNKSNEKTTNYKKNSNAEFDVYFSKLNAYFQNIWDLLINNSKKISDKETVEIEFFVDESGLISVKNSDISPTTAIKQLALMFIDKVNSDKKNLGNPPLFKAYNGKIKLSVILSIEEIK